MTTSENSLIVYWTSPMVNERESWSHLYPSPTNVLNYYRKNKNVEAKVGTFFACPAVTDAFKNVFMFQHPLNNVVNVPEGIENIVIENNNRVFIETNSSIGIYKQRMESIEGYTNVSYNMAWLFFAEEPVQARFTAPYFPSVTPAEGVLFATGEYDIGSWFRKFNVDYHLPNEVRTLTFKENDPLFFLEIKTNKKVVFKRFIVTDRLLNLASECASAPSRYGFFKSLSERYEKAKKAQLSETVLFEIKKNLID